MFSYYKNKRKSKIKDVIIKNIPPVHYREILINNVIEEDLQSVLKPLNLMQSLFICAKYSIRDNFITSNTTLYNILGFSITVLFCSLIIYNLLMSIHGWQGLSFNLGYYSVYDFVFNAIGFFINCFSNIINCNNNTLLVMKIQHVHRILKIDGIYLKSLVISNAAYIIILNHIYILGIIFLSLHFPHNNFLDVILNIMVGYSSICFDINIAYATFFINLLRTTLSGWLEEVQISRNDINSESHWNIKFDLYLDILQAYKIFEKAFQLLIIYYITHTVYHGLMNVVTLLEMKQILTDGGEHFILYAVISQMWLVKSTVLQILLCIKSEKFYETMIEVQNVCALLKSRGCLDKHRRICKNIQRQQITSFKKLNVFGLLVIDATLPFQIYNIITTYTLTLLQFDLS